MAEELAAIEVPLALQLREMARQWMDTGKQLSRPQARIMPRNSASPQVDLLRITSSSGNTDGYPCVQRIENADGTWSEPYLPARAVHALGTALTSGDIYLGRVVRVATTGELVYVVGAQPGSGSGSLEVLGRTGDIAAVTKLTVGNAVLTGTAGAAVLTLDVASASLAGIVNLVAQTMGDGVKTFIKTIVSDVPSSLDTFSAYPAITLQRDDNPIVYIRSELVTPFGGVNGATDAIFCAYVSSSNPTSDGTTFRVVDYTTALGPKVYPSEGICLQGGEGSEPDPVYMLGNASGTTIYTGKTGTGGGGDTVKGGIITTLGPALGTLASRNAAADVGALTDNTGGAADQIIDAMTSMTVYATDAVVIRDNLASLAAQCNLIRTNLRAAGIMS